MFIENKKLTTKVLEIEKQNNNISENQTVYEKKSTDIEKK